MPLDFVTSNAGHPMLVIDHYTFHKHSANPKTGRTNWRCSRRRVKDIRCPSSCNTLHDYSSIPSSHDPNCHPYTNAELMAYRTKRNNKTQLSQMIPNRTHFDITRESEVSKQVLINDYNINSFENREICSDEEEINDVLNDLDRNGEQFNNDEDFMYQNELNLNEQNLSSQTESNEGDYTEDHPDDLTQENIDSVADEFIEPNYTISEIINQKIEPLTKRTSEELAQQDKSTDILSEKSISFVTSKVGHPMLVVNHYTFHKHSTNPKTGRINWRCSRRRVKETRCSSSCYTVNGIVSDPSSHDPNCLPLTDELLKNYQNKRAKISVSSLINTKADSYTTNKNSSHIKSEFGKLETLESSEFSITKPIYTRPRLFYKSKRKENLPVRSKDNIQRVNDENCNNNTSDISQTSTDNTEEEFFENEYDNGFAFHENDEQKEHLAEYDINQAYESQNGKSINQSNESASTSAFSCQEYDTMNYTSSPESNSKILNELSDLKEKEINYAQKLKM